MTVLSAYKEVHAIILDTTKPLRVRAKGHLLITCKPYPTKLRA